MILLQTYASFFSNGLDPEYTVIGRVARRIWAIAFGINTELISLTKTKISHSDQWALTPRAGD